LRSSNQPASKIARVADQWKKITDYAAVAFKDFEFQFVPFGWDWRAILNAQGVPVAR
jgi:hypothetical protein